VNKRLLVSCLAYLSLAACNSAGGLNSMPDSPFAPSGVKAGEDSVDGLIVGHRLMESGEYELALKAYYRAAAEHGMNVDVLSALGSANLKLGRLGQAEDLLRQALKVDETFVPAWNNLGVVLMEQGKIGEAERVFHTAYALDSGESAEIRENLLLAIAKLDSSSYVEEEDNSTFALVRRGQSEYVLLSTQ
jgi:Flp pilus assembly protein TadD